MRTSDDLSQALSLLACAAVYAVLTWATGVLLLTRQSLWLLVLMAGVAAGCGGLALYARRRGWRGLLAMALSGLGLSVVLGVLALADLLEPGA